ncbi:hypothetical protein [Mesobacillus maritimus]|uniref:Uncharacterized protein n=1 Tax=Mesobacillus maritimus TaxID=1643336 RepID=A0ABS7KBD8_9BACI|nr:hypothetical protein [Mesobacillus maritimus]MBY0099591.1 hypothetical protein [Mesobacillus maritimus]
MKEWWNKMKGKRRMRRNGRDTYTFTDFIFDLLFYIPELILLPFRMIYWFVRGIGKVLDSIFDII